MTSSSTHPDILRSRAVETVIWGMPAVNFQRLVDAMAAAGGRLNEIVCWPTLFDWHNQTLTPNPDTLYFLPFFDLRDGPMVLEIPPAQGGSITGTVMDAWQCALADVGPAGEDRGAGARYLLIPPGSDVEPDAGYVPLRCDTVRAYAVLRSNVRSGSDADVAAAAEYGRRVQVYALADAADPPAATMVDASERVFDSLIQYDERFFATLDDFVQTEPWLTRDKAMIHQVASLGIVRGETYEPGPAAAVLAEAPALARDFIDARYEELFDPPFYPGTHWAVPVPQTVITGQAGFYSEPDSYPVDERAVLFSIAYFSPKHLGAGQFYLLCISDSGGAPLDAAATYRLVVPADPPVELYWSATVYDRRTHALIRDLPRASRSSIAPDIVTDTDGSTDIYMGPQAPDGHEANWIPTGGRGEFEVLFRFYGPTAALGDKTWRLPGIDRLT